MGVKQLSEVRELDVNFGTTKQFIQSNINIISPSNKIHAYLCLFAETKTKTTNYQLSFTDRYCRNSSLFILPMSKSPSCTEISFIGQTKLIWITQT